MLLKNSEKRNKLVRFEACSKGSVQVYSTERKTKRLPAYTLFIGQNCSGYVDNIINSWNSKLDPTSPLIHTPTAWFNALIDNLNDQTNICFEVGQNIKNTETIETIFNIIVEINNNVAEVIFEYDCINDVIIVPIDLSL